MADDLVRRPDLARQRVEGSLQAGSLAQLVKEREQERGTFLLLDCSGSMDHRTEPGSQTRKIDALRRLVRDLREQGVRCPLVAFRDYKAYFVEAIPEPDGSTPLAEAIAFSRAERGQHLIVISDGAPDSEPKALAEARLFGGPIDVFYVGPPGTRGETFLRELAAASGGRSQTVSLSQTKQLTTAIRGLLTSG